MQPGYLTDPVSRQLVEHREPLSERDFVRRMVRGLPRADQRRWAEIYLHGLINVAGRKSIRKIAELVGDRSSVQSLQQFVNRSPWAWEPVRREITRYLVDHSRVHGWSIERAVIPKRGDHSVGVARRFEPSAGRLLNCQVGVGLHLVVDNALVPVSWRLLLSDRWSEYGEHRRRCRIPDVEAGATEHEHVLGMLRELEPVAPELPLLLDLTDTDWPADSLAALAARGVGFIAEVAATASAVRAGTAPVATVGDRVRSGAPVDLPLRWDPAGGSEVTRIRTSTAALVPLGPPVRIASLRRAAEPDRSRYWITNLVDRSPTSLARLLARHTCAAHDLVASQDRHGVRDFEGRTYQGWHHHMTLASAAHVWEVVRGG